jgi:UDP-galactopyranose mutase
MSRLENLKKLETNLLKNIEVLLNTDFLDNIEYYKLISKKIIYTGPVDKFYNYSEGYLEYRPLKFKHEIIESNNHQGHSVINYTEKNIPYTRIIEHKHFNYKDTKYTVVTKEYPIEWNINEEPYYPINDNTNQNIFTKYKNLTKQETNVFFGGRLAEYKYYDMNQVVESALKLVDEIKLNNID